MPTALALCTKYKWKQKEDARQLGAIAKIGAFVSMLFFLGGL
jgi:hypothetical protein